VIGVCYVLSPLSVLCALAMIPLLRWAGRGLDERERRWLMAVLVTAVAARVIVILGLFLVTDHRLVPFGSLFGDEEYFIRRSLWMRNVAMGLPMHRADFIYAYDDYSRTSFLYVLAALQALVGPAPYGAHVFSILCYVGASIVLYRLVRPTYGRLPALLGLVMLLFLPTQFAWSLSALKEPLYFFVMSVGLAAAVTIGRPGPYLKRVLAIALLIGSAVVAQTIREGGLAMAGAAAAGGLALALFGRRPRFVVALAIVCLMATPFVVSRGTFKDRVVSAVHQVAGVHWGHVNTSGYIYTILDRSFYVRRAAVDEMTFKQGAQYVIGSLLTYVVVPLPWKIQSRAALAYLPEQIVWYLMVLLVPIGIASGLRRDVLLTALLVTYAATAALLVAITSGNVGTLVRHRGLAVPYVLWFSALAGCDVIAWLTRGNSRQDVYVDHR
jgi:4-amino-4-deoxy-L-arabinose transferase-like glycosyltransferase